MDKYTIDLDKVLNDFEYSELTEQSNGYSNASNTSQPVFSYADPNRKYNETLPFEAQTYPKIPSTTTKHSINNVFHSLNEYLNSDIKDFQKPELTEANDIETNVPTFVSKPQTSIQNIFKNISTDAQPSYGTNLIEPVNSNLIYTNSNLTFPSTSSMQHNPILNPPLSSDKPFYTPNATYPNLNQSNLTFQPLPPNPNPTYQTAQSIEPNPTFEHQPNKYVPIQPLKVDSNLTLISDSSTNKPNPTFEQLPTEYVPIQPLKVISNLTDSTIEPNPTFDRNTKKSDSENKFFMPIHPVPLNSETALTSTKSSLDDTLIAPITLNTNLNVDSSNFSIEPNPTFESQSSESLLDINDSKTVDSNLNSDLSFSADPNPTSGRKISVDEILEASVGMDSNPILNTSLNNSIDSSIVLENKFVELDLGLSKQNSDQNQGLGLGMALHDVKHNPTFIENNLDLKTSSEEQKYVATPLESNIDSLSSRLSEERQMDILDFEPTNEYKNHEELNTSFICTNFKNSNEKDAKNNSEIIEHKFEPKSNEILPDSTYSDEESSIKSVKEDSQNNKEVNPVKFEQNSSSHNQEIKNDLSKNTNFEKNQEKSDNLHPKLLENKNILKSNIDKYENKELIQENLVRMKESNVKIGFEDDFEISDTEMENELAQLEEEYKEKVVNEAKNLEKVNVETENVDKLDKAIVQEEISEDKVVIKEDEARKSDDTNVEIKQNENDVNIVDKSSVEVKISVNITEDLIEQHKTLETDKKEENREENDKNAEMEKNSSTNRENFALLRPNSLDINHETPETPINLIGNPGSTPYNNVCVGSSMQTDPNTLSPAPHGSESEANQSLSPTVSEVSTSEASDSPNTSDSCNDTSLDDNLNDSTSKDDKSGVKGAEGAAAQNPQEGPSGSQTPGAGDDRGAVPGAWLGKTAPFWTPDSDTLNCLQCDLKFTVIKRRHHCRACGLVLCSKCCSQKFPLPYMDNQEARVCTRCHEILSQQPAASSGSEGSAESQGSPAQTQAQAQARQLNPGNPMDYCSVVPPLQQMGGVPVSPPSVMVPVGVLKRKGSGKSRGGKSVMFCDGIRPGCDLTELDYDFNYKASQTSSSRTPSQVPVKANRNVPKLDTKTNSYIPNEENSLPPTVNVVKSEISYSDCANNMSVVEMLKNETLTFAVQRNLHIHVRIINMDCCINKHAWCFSTEGMISVGQDEIVILLEFVDNEKIVPKDMFVHLNNIYSEAVKGTSITEMGLSIHNSSNFLESKNHAGFLYVKPTFQCVQNVIIPNEPYLMGILIHRWETPWAKIFPLRLLLRLGAEYRYYPSPIISTRHRESVYVEIGHTIINLLADFRNFSYTLPNVRGLTIHMKEKNTTVSIPINRYDQVMKALNNSSDHILAFAANFSPKADSHLVCIQDTHGNNENAYTTHAINIQNKPRKVTGASFIVLNGALKSSSGLTAKSSIVEDGLMIQILPEQMVKLRSSLRNMKDFKINCGCVNAQSDEFVNIVWTENDVNFNVGVNSPIDNMALSGVPSIRVHNGRDYICNSGNKLIRWTEVFIIQSGDENIRTQEPVDISKLSESISKATCQALVKYLDLLATNSFLKIGIRTNLHVENVSYLAGANGVKLPPIYMKSLDNELIPILHKITSNNLGENAIVIELIFHILNM